MKKQERRIHFHGIFFRTLSPAQEDTSETNLKDFFK